jgi:hypothetical protein
MAIVFSLEKVYRAALPDSGIQGACHPEHRKTIQYERLLKVKKEKTNMWETLS